MKELIKITNEENFITERGTILSPDLVTIINEFRKIESEANEEKRFIELKHKSLMEKIRTELKVLETLNLDNKNHITLTTYKDIQERTQPCYELDSQGLKFLIDTTKTKDRIPLIDIYNKISNSKELYIYKEKKEYKFIGALMDSLKGIGIEKSIPEYYCCSKYRIDLYLPELNIAIEYDENNHRGYSYEQQERRQIEIEENLKCKFIRVNSEDGLFYNIGYCIKEIEKIKNENIFDDMIKTIINIDKENFKKGYKDFDYCIYDSILINLNKELNEEIEEKIKEINKNISEEEGKKEIDEYCTYINIDTSNISTMSDGIVEIMDCINSIFGNAHFINTRINY